jgi:uncharacterized protein (DUF1810 family)
MGDPDPANEDPYQLDRFVRAQEIAFQQALKEIRSGTKRTHWMWYIFPQLDGLAFSENAKYYALKSIEEARAYLTHPVLGPRLHQCSEEVIALDGRSATDIFCSPDDLKLRSCATLFACISPVASVFDHLLEKYFAGERDQKTIRLLGLDQSGA